MNKSQKLIFVGGAPGVGKTATCERLYRSMPDSIMLDGDDLWCRMNPFRIDQRTISMIEKNITTVLQNFLEAGFSTIILSWVLHKEEIVDRLLKSLEDRTFSFYWFTLVCDQDTLRSRWTSTHSSSDDFKHASARLQQTRLLTQSHIIDTTAISFEEVVRIVVERIQNQEERT